MAVGRWTAAGEMKRHNGSEPERVWSGLRGVLHTCSMQACARDRERACIAHPRLNPGLNLSSTGISQLRIGIAGTITISGMEQRCLCDTHPIY